MPGCGAERAGAGGGFVGAGTGEVGCTFIEGQRAKNVQSHVLAHLHQMTEDAEEAGTFVAVLLLTKILPRMTPCTSTWGYQCPSIESADGSGHRLACVNFEADTGIIGARVLFGAKP